MSYQPNAGMVVAPGGGGGNRNWRNMPVGPDGREWSHGLFDCFDDTGTCLTACCFPCIMYAKIKHRYEHLNGRGFPDPERGGSLFSGDCMLHTFTHACFNAGWILQMGQRSSIRQRYNIKGDSWGDCCTALWCTACELTQESRELELEEQSFDVGQGGVGQVGVGQVGVGQVSVGQVGVGRVGAGKGGEH